MRRIWLVVFSVLTSTAAFAQGSKDKAQGVRGTQVYMQEKLAEAQMLLGALARGDYSSLQQNSKRLQDLIVAAGWHKMDDPDFTRYASNYRESLLAMQEAAQAKNNDAVAMAYVRITLGCVQCHGMVRDKAK